MLSKIKYKLWRRYLAKYILKNHFKVGVELGVKAGRSFKVFLKLNPELVLTGIDNWEVLPNSPYRKNKEYEEKCRKIAKTFGSRAVLMKADAIESANSFEDNSLDFIFYDLFNYRVSTVDFHKSVFRAWFPKLKQEGQMIGRDFLEPDISNALKAIGYSWRFCTIGKNQSPRLGYVRALNTDSEERVNLSVPHSSLPVKRNVGNGPHTKPQRHKEMTENEIGGIGAGDSNSRDSS